MPASRDDLHTMQVQKNPHSNKHEQTRPKQTRETEQQASKRKQKLAAKPYVYKHAAAPPLARRLSLPQSDTAAQTEPECKPRQVGMYDRPWRKHMKASNSDKQPEQQDAVAAAAAAAVRGRPVAASKVTNKLCTDAGPSCFMPTT